MGKKYIVKIGRLERLYKAFVNGNGMPNLTWLSPEVDLTPYTEPDMEQVRKEAYQKGLSDAWETARKIANIPYGEEEKVIGSDGWTFIVNHTASEAIEKIRQYEQEKEEQIQVGDEVIYDGRRCVVITPETTKRYGSVMDAEGRRYLFENKEVEKTGCHFSEITEVLQKMKEKE